MTNYIKVLNINCDSSEFGGVPVFLINVFRNIDHNQIQFDFLTPDITSYNPWREEIERAGSNIFEFHIDCSTIRGKIKFGRRLRSFLVDHPYNIVHIHCGVVSFDCISAVAAKSQGAKVVVHSHNTSIRGWWKAPIVFFMKLLMQKKANVLCACSMEAARNIFTSHKVNSGKVIIINNGIDLKKFCYSQKTRTLIREELEINENFVVGHVGRFAEQKNHIFLIDIFAEILREKPESVLLLVGEGEWESLIRDKVKDMNLENSVIFLGQRDDVENLYPAMDIFLFPSLFEGLGIVLLEAQTNGLPCFISDVIPPEVDITPLIHRVSLKSPTNVWVETILSNVPELDQRHSWEQELSEAGYGIDFTVAQVVQIYEMLS